MRSSAARLFLLSLLALQLELAVIRWTGSHVLYLSYFANFVLLGCFLGLGAGALAAWRKLDLLDLFPFMLALLVGGVLGTEVQVRIDSPDAIYFQNGLGRLALPDWVVLPLAFLLVSLLFVCVGQALGRALKEGAPLRVYTINIVGSLAGIALFSAGSWLRAPAWTWFAVSALLYLAVQPVKPRRTLDLALLVAVVAGIGWAERADSWSPYYRWRVLDDGPRQTACSLDLCLDANQGRPLPVRGPWQRLKVNAVTHQYITDFRQREPFYEFPYLALGKPPGRVLVIGAGNGTDTAFALAYGAGRVDAVEIDPDIAQLGRTVNPSKPFEDPRVRVIVADGRAVLERSREQYDLVIFGLPDSLTLASSHASVRLESFLFTVEALRAARARLAPGGLLVLYNYYRETWLVEKLAGMLREAFGRDPVTLKGPDKNLTAVLLAGPGQDAIPAQLGAAWGFTRITPGQTAKPATDDWPFLYLRAPSVPAFYQRALLPMALYTLLLLFLVAPRGASRQPNPAFFFMGAAFLLLETSSVVRFALIFGSTWLVNAFVFSLILSMVLLANLIVARWRVGQTWPLVAGIFVALAVQWAVPLSILNHLPGVARYLAAGALVFSPVLLANILYSRTFREAGDVDRAYAWNLLGAMGGGLFEYATLWVGYRALLVIVGLFYALAILFIVRFSAVSRR
jgi:SAM-dependent methyltransferase